MTTHLKETKTDNILTITTDNFTSLVLEAAGPVVVEFMSYGCGHCRALEPILQEVAGKEKSKENIFRVNIAVEQTLAADYGIQGTPTLVKFQDGNEVGRVEGPSPTMSSLMEFVLESPK